MTMPEDRRRGFATRAVHGGRARPVEQTPSSVPIYQTSTWRFDTSEDYAEVINFRRPGYVYGRGYGNPTVEAFERVMADLEGTEAAYGFGSGMAAIHTAATTLARSGDRVVSSPELYGGAYSLFHHVLPRYGIEVQFVSPHEFGFDMVLHSATKYIGGHHDLIGGVACTTEDLRNRLRATAIDTGGAMQPLDAWLAVRGLITLELRMQRHSSNAQSVAEFLEGHPKVERVRYPGLASHPHHEIARRELPRGSGGMLAFEVEGGVDPAVRFCDALELSWVGTSLGGHKTLVGHAASTTHRQMDPDTRRAAGIGDGLIRVSVGLEDPDDVIQDFDRALEKA